jgi:GAF domain-containing protein
MEFIQKLLPKYTPPSIAEKGNLFIVREKILQTFFIGLFILGIPVIGYAATSSVRNHQPGLAVLYIMVFGWVLFSMVSRQAPYMLRAGTLIFLGYALAISELWDSGSLGEIRFWLLVMVVVASVFTNLWVGVGSTVLATLTVFLMGVGLEANLIHIANSDMFFGGTSYLLSSAIMLMISVGIVISISTLLSGLNRAIVDNEEITNNLRSERVQLEKRIEERTVDIQRRLLQVRTAADISRAISRITDPEVILQQVVNLVKERLDLYYVGIFTLDENGKNAVLRAGTGEAGQAMLAQHHALQIGGSSMIGWSIANRQPRIALDTGSEAVRFNNPFLPRTRSELALPILSRNEVLGAMTVQSEQSQAFDQEDIIILQSIADGLAIALENSRLYGELQENLDEVRALNRNYVRDSWGEVLGDAGEISVSYANQLSAAENNSSLTPVDIPILLREQVIGRLTLETNGQELTEEDLALIDALTTQTALALENARLVQETERRAIQEQKLNTFSNRFNRALDIDNILKVAVEEFGHLPAVTEATIQLLPPSAFDEVSPAATPGGNGKERVG